MRLCRSVRVRDTVGGEAERVPDSVGEEVRLKLSVRVEVADALREWVVVPAEKGAVVPGGRWGGGFGTRPWCWFAWGGGGERGVLRNRMACLKNLNRWWVGGGGMRGFSLRGSIVGGGGVGGKLNGGAHQM